ncbi:cobyrinate a,c-diamide synthase [Ralstonia solanacearum]|uniref:cobyrinate a,c-diamide synthase n=1 Tax=Ralstonia solanacearum TaxID=305 RepID=UPI00202A7E0D|nr:cobyrinate a,c-diamide synthase [Ralstonia solanacearum]MCL9853930.1 cobyrinate a,c-diamide synthase [Ralstonia solanacearum]
MTMATPADTARHCPALFLSAPASHQGKTTLTAGLARHHRNRGRTVRVFKTGPDYLDPYILERASGQPVHSLDLWMTGEADCRQRLYAAAAEADLILIEGAMGLFDGTPSSADLAEAFGVPVLALIDASAMAQTFAAIAHGLASFRPTLPFYGVLANQVASPRHAELLTAALPAGLRCFGTVARDRAMTLPERHLGLVMAQEIDNLERRLEHAAARIAATDLATLPPPVAFAPAHAEPVPPLLAGTRIAVARDAAFSFLYPANLELLARLGAELRLFSPLADAALPEADAVYLPGGYPELHLDTLAANLTMQAALRAHASAGKPLYAECGGMLYLADTLTDATGQRGTMAGLLPGTATLHTRLAGLGLQSVDLGHGELRGHTFHYSSLETPLAPAARAHRAGSAAPGEAVYRHGSIVASYLHAYFPSNPVATARLFRP